MLDCIINLIFRNSLCFEDCIDEKTFVRSLMPINTIICQTISCCDAKSSGRENELLFILVIMCSLHRLNGNSNGHDRCVSVFCCMFFFSVGMAAQASFCSRELNETFTQNSFSYYMQNGKQMLGDYKHPGKELCGALRATWQYFEVLCYLPCLSFHCFI